MKCWWSTAVVVVSVLAVAASGIRAEGVKLQDVWKTSTVGVIIQVPSSSTLIIQPSISGTPFLLNGQRLVIRAAHVRLVAHTDIRSFAFGAAPAAPPGYSTAGQGGPNGSDDGGDGSPGSQGTEGKGGDPGQPSASITLTLGDVTGDGSVLFSAVGEMGGAGQKGQEGGKGGRAGRGSDSAKSWPNCDYGGGPAGTPGDGGPGGKGGAGGPGGSGGPVKYTASIQSHVTVLKGGMAPPPETPGQILIDVSGGKGGAPGPGGIGGDGGDGNDGGAGGGACGGGKGSGKKDRHPDQTLDLGVGPRGSDGTTAIVQ